MRNLILAAFSGVLLAMPFVAMPITPLGANVRNDLGDKKILYRSSQFELD
jgi:hypothetical protein